MSVLATGTSLAADDPGIMSVRNPGAGSAVLLDVVYRDSHQPFSRAFTNDEISFQLLPGAVARSAPSGAITVRVERTWLAPQQVLEQTSGVIAAPHYQLFAMKVAKLTGQ